MTVTPTFYKLDGTVVIADPVTIQSAEIRYVDIKQLLPEQHRQSRDWGGFSLSYFGFNREMWAQVRFLGVNGGKNVDEFFTVKQESNSDQLEATWWAPEPSQAILALGNITDNDTSAIVSFGNDQSQAVHLAPHATRVIYHDKTKGRTVGSAAIKVTGAPGSIVPTGLITARNGKFNSVIRFYSPKLAKQANLYANGFRVTGNTPHMVLRNTTTSPVAVVPKFIPLTGIQGTPLVLPKLELGPNEVTEVDLSALLHAARKRPSLDVVSVEITNPAAPGSVIGAIYGIDNKTGMTYDVPLRDSGPVRTMTGSYPWKITDDFTTIVYITNISDQKAQFIGEVNFNGGRVLIDPRTLEPGETAAFDMKEFRDHQIPDNAGKVVPETVSLGQFKWSVRGVTNGKLLLIGRAEMVSRSQDISTSYSCNDPCPPYIIGSLDPFLPPIILLATTGNSSAWATAYYGNGYVSGPYSSGAEWTPDNSNVSVDPTSAHTTTAAGDFPGGGVCVNAHMGYEESYGWDGLNCYDNYNQYAVGDQTCTEVLDVHIKQGSNNITGTTQNVIVGQQIPLSVEVVGSTEAPSNIQWSVPGTRVANFSASSSSGTVTQLNNLQASSLTFYWVDGGDNREVTLGCRIGTTQFNKNAIFNVKRPTGSITTSTGSVALDNASGGSFSLHFGVISTSGTPGITFTRSISVPSGFSGDTQWVQIVDSTTRTKTPNGANTLTLQGSGVLDTNYPYTSAITSAEDSPRSAVDPCTFSFISVSDSYTMHLMFKPSGANSLWVPLRQVSWNWSGSGGRFTTCGWILSTSNHSTNPTDQDSTDYPTWTGNVTGLTFQ